MKKILIVLVSLIVIAAGLAIWGYTIVSNRYSGEPKRIYITASTDLNKLIADSLGKWGKDVNTVRSFLKSNKSRAGGSYLIKDGETTLEFARRLRNGAQDPLMVTVPQARTISALNRAVASQLETGAEELQSAEDSIFSARSFSSTDYPGLILPDTYEMYWNTSATKVVEKLLGERDKFWNDQRIEKARSINLTPSQVSTLASIVEEETACHDEYPIVARLYLNRLERGIKLQADPTVKYAVGDPTLRRILNRHLTVESPYNTYLYQGLPPGPIRIPGKRSIEAVLNAPKHNYLYMCAKEDFSGRHNFTSDYSQHLANAKRYQAALNHRNIK